MKTAIFIEEGLTQLVLTPENDWEEAAIRGVDDQKNTVSVYRGSFYSSHGGWMRQGNTDKSLIVCLRFRPKDESGLKTSDEIVL